MRRLVRVYPKPGKRARRGHNRPATGAVLGQNRPARVIRLRAEGGGRGGPYTPPAAPFRHDVLIAGGLFSLVWKAFGWGMAPRGY